MSEVFFFTDLDPLEKQVQGKEFGIVEYPVPSIEEGFRVSSIHKSNSNLLNAYSILPGSILLVEDENSLKTSNSGNLNLILKPTAVPNTYSPKIKYFIYRGIKKSSLIASDGLSLLPKETNALLKLTWEQQEKINEANKTNVDPTINHLGIPYLRSLSDNISIDSLFQNEQSDFQIPFIKKSGELLAEFDPNGFSLEIIFDNSGYFPDLELLKKDENIIRSVIESQISNPKEQLDFNRERSEILNYLDPCAFYGLLSTENIKYYKNGSIENLQGKEIYDTILNEKFINASKVYLDIRNEFNHSINFMSNYSDNINLLPRLNKEIDYYRSGWPILVLETSDLNLPLISKEDIEIDLFLPKGNNNDPYIYLASGLLTENFPDTSLGSRLIKATGVSPHSTEHIESLQLTLSSRIISGDHQFISNYIRIKYIKGKFHNSSNDTTSNHNILSSNSLDKIFKSNQLKLFYSNNPGIVINMYEDDVFIDLSDTLSVQYIGKIGIAEDKKGGIYYFVIPEIFIPLDKSISTEKPLPITSGKINSDVDFLSYVANLYGNIRLGKKEIKENNTTSNLFEFSTDSNKRSLNCQAPTPFGFICLGFKKTEFESIDLSSLKNDFDIFISLNEKQTNTDDNGYKYFEYSLGFTGYSESTSDFSTTDISSTIKLYFHGHSI